MTAFDYQQWRTASAVTPEMLDSCLDRIAELEADVAEADILAAMVQKQKTTIPEQRKKLEQAEAELAALKGREDEAVKRMELARIGNPRLPGSKEYNEGINRCIAILEILGGAAREEKP